MSSATRPRKPGGMQLSASRTNSLQGLDNSPEETSGKAEGPNKGRLQSLFRGDASFGLVKLAAPNPSVQCREIKSQVMSARTFARLTDITHLCHAQIPRNPQNAPMKRAMKGSWLTPNENPYMST